MPPFKKTVLAFVRSFCVWVSVCEKVSVSWFSLFAIYVFAGVEMRHPLIFFSCPLSFFISLALLLSPALCLYYIACVRNTLFYFYFHLNLLCEWHWNGFYCCYSMDLVCFFFFAQRFVRKVNEKKNSNTFENFTIRHWKCVFVLRSVDFFIHFFWGGLKWNIFDFINLAHTHTRDPSQNDIVDDDHFLKLCRVDNSTCYTHMMNVCSVYTKSFHFLQYDVFVCLNFRWHFRMTKKSRRRIDWQI